VVVLLVLLLHLLQVEQAAVAQAVEVQLMEPQAHLTQAAVVVVDLTMELLSLTEALAVQEL
jgi:hypothetical protein